MPSVNLICIPSDTHWPQMDVLVFSLSSPCLFHMSKSWMEVTRQGVLSVMCVSIHTKTRAGSKRLWMANSLCILDQVMWWPYWYLSIIAAAESTSPCGKVFDLAAGSTWNSFGAQHPGYLLDVVRQAVAAGTILSMCTLDLWVAQAEVDSVLPLWLCWWRWATSQWWLCQLFACMCLVEAESKSCKTSSLFLEVLPSTYVEYKWPLACGCMGCLRWSQLEVPFSMCVSPERSCRVSSVSGLGGRSSGADNQRGML